MDQLSFASLAAVVPWVALEALVEPHYPKIGPNGGWRPFPLAVMLRIYCLQPAAVVQPVGFQRGGSALRHLVDAHGCGFGAWSRRYTG